MDEDVEDIRKLEEILKKESENENNLQEEFDDFLNCISDDDEPLDGFTTENIDFEEFDINKVEEIASNYYNINKSNFNNDINLIKYYLKKDEIRIINSCKDSRLKRILILNRVKHIQLQSIRMNLYDSLKKCVSSIKDTQSKIKEFYKKSHVNYKSIIPKLGYPYFMSKDGISAFPNADIQRKRKNKELSIDYLPHVARWTVDDQLILNRAVIFNYYNTCIEDLEKKLRTLCILKKKTTDAETVDLIIKDIENAESELDDLKKCENPLPPPLNTKNINWISISCDDLKGRHSPNSCEAFWNQYLHPSINKSNWSDNENKAIQGLVKKYNYQNWDAIAADLQNNRSGFSVCIHYHARCNDRFRKDRFEPEEDEFVMEVVESCRIGNYIPWTKVAHYFCNRTKAQIYHRYRYYLKYENVTKGVFSEAEDVLLLCLINKFGKDFSKCASYMQNRSPTQLSHRYNNYLKNDGLNFGNWTVMEDKKILEHVKQHGPKKWSLIIGALRRNRTHIRQRYMVLSKWLNQHSSKTIENIQRRKQSYRQKNDLKTIRAAADLFKNSTEIPSIQTIKTCLKKVDKTITFRAEKKQANHTNNTIDLELINFFQSTCKVKTGRKVTQKSLRQEVAVIKAFLSLMEVNLEIPDEDTMINDPQLDELDVEILTILKEDSDESISSFLPSCSQSNFEIPTSTRFSLGQISLLPPNINSLVGLRSVLITHDAFRARIKDSANSNNSPSTHQSLLKLDNNSHHEAIQQQKMFEKRFTILFTWPCLMSVVEPNENLNLLSTVLNPVTDKEVEKLHPKVGRPRKDFTKIDLMLQAKRNKALQKEKCETTINPLKVLNGCSALDFIGNNYTLHSEGNETSHASNSKRSRNKNEWYIRKIEKLKQVNTTIPNVSKPLKTVINKRKRQSSDSAVNTVQKIKIEEVE